MLLVSLQPSLRNLSGQRGLEEELLVCGEAGEAPWPHATRWLCWPHTMNLFMLLFNPGIPKRLKSLIHVFFFFNNDAET